MNWGQSNSTAVAAAVIIIIAIAALGGISWAFSGHIQF